MTLSAEVQARFSAQRLIELTNPDNAPATTIDSTRLNNAIADVGADFQIYAGVVLDDTNALHIAVGVQGVEAYLMMRQGVTSEERNKLFDKWKERLKEMSKVGARDRILPQTTSTLEPSEERAGAKPFFDYQSMSDLVPDQPHSSDDIQELD
jgi:hypothetical protein